MDKKKVTELIQEAKHLAILRKYENRQTYLNNCICRLKEALKELNKPDWVSVEDELPPYNEAVLVCHKDFPCNVRIANRVAGERNSFIDSNGFTHDEFDLPVSHWKPIEKLED